MLVIAHRGANREAPENSFEAFEKAVDAKAQRIELDVQLTKDGRAAVIHDEDARRTAKVAARIVDLTAEEVRALRLDNGEPVPLLEEVLERFLPRIEINIEMKGRDPKIADAVAKAAASSPYRDRVIVSAFHWESLTRLMEIAPKLARACLWGRDTATWPFFATYAPQIYMEKCRATIIHPDIGLVDDALMDQAELRGWTVYPWCGMQAEENDREGIWAAMKTYGVAGLCTNYPRQLKAWLDDAARDDRLAADLSIGALRP